MRHLFTSFSLLLSCTVFAQPQQQIDNIYTFTRLYGYVRYFHPSDAAVVTDWDKLAVYGAQEASKAASPEALKATLEKLFQPIAPTLRLYAGTPPAMTGKDIAPRGAGKMKVCAWQHKGYGFGSTRGLYESVRTNSYVRVRPQQKGPDFGTIAATLDAKPYRGQRIRYSAAISAEALENGTGNLWLRVDRANQQMGFFDNMGNRPVKGKALPWKRFEITGKVDDDAERIVYGCFLKGEGSFFLDDVRLEVETPQGWQPVPGINGDFEKDTLDKLPGLWNAAPDGQFRVAVTKQTAAGGTQALYLSRHTDAGGYKPAGPLFANTLPAGYILQKDIGSGLGCLLPVTLWTDGQRTYPLTDTAKATAFNRYMEEHTDSAQLYTRLADIVIAWNIFQHFHPYYQEWTTNWDADLRAAIAQSYQDRSNEEFANTFKAMLAKMRDGHIFVSYPDNAVTWFLPLKWGWAENQLVVDKVLLPEVPLQAGDVVTHINGVPAADYLKNKERFVPSGSESGLLSRALQTIAAGPKDAPLELTVLSGGQTRQATVHYSMNAAPWHAARPKDSIRQLDNNIYYVNLDQVPWEKLEPQLPALAAAKAVIFDLRGYPNGMSGAYIIRYLQQQPEDAKWMHVPLVALPDHEGVTWASEGWQSKPAQPHIKGKVYFLTGGGAISYAESVMGYIRDLHLATIIGEPTAGTNGDINNIQLPGGYTFSFTGLKVTNHDGSQHFMKGITPDIPVQRTIKGIREGRDEYLEKAIQLANE